MSSKPKPPPEYIEAMLGTLDALWDAMPDASAVSALLPPISIAEVERNMDLFAEAIRASGQTIAAPIAQTTHSQGVERS